MGTHSHEMELVDGITAFIRPDARQRNLTRTARPTLYSQRSIQSAQRVFARDLL